jgi:hypothetical protein
MPATAMALTQLQAGKFLRPRLVSAPGGARGPPQLWRVLSALACGLEWGVWQLRNRGYFSGSLMGSLPADPLAGGIVPPMGVVFSGLVVCAGMTPPIIFDILLNGGPKHLAVKLAVLFAIGPIGNLAQLIGTGAAVYLYFQARSR